MRRRLEDIEAIVFDWDGTLVDSVEPKIRQNLMLAHTFDNPLTEEDVRRYWAEAQDYHELMQKLCPGVDISEIQTEVDRHYNDPDFKKKRFDFNIEHLIHTLSSHDDIKTGIATSITRDLLKRDAASAAIQFDLKSSALSFTQTADDTEFRKPNGDFFQPTLKFFRQVGITAEKIMYIGDEVKDVYAAQDAGMQVVGVRSGLATAHDFNRLDVPHIANAYEILNYT